MSFAAEMKDFVSAFKVGSDIVDKGERRNKVSSADKKAADEARERKEAEDAGEKAFESRRGQSLSAIPEAGSGARKVSNEPVGEPSEVENRFISTVKAGDDDVPGLTNPYGLAAAAATARAESSYKPTAVNDTWSDPSEKGVPGRSGGLMSWRDDRYGNMTKFATERGEKPGAFTPETQGKFFLRENPALIKGLNSARSVDEAMSLINDAWRFKGFNRPNDPEVARRRGYAEEYYKRFGTPPQQQAALPVEGNDDVVAYAAEGGVIDPEEAEIATEVPEGEYASVRALPIDAKGAPAPEAIAKPAVREDTSNSPDAGARQFLNTEKANEAVAAGMDYIQQLFGGGNAAIPQASPDRAQQINAFARNEGVGTSKDIKEIDSIIDPKGELAPHLRAMARLSGAYEMYLRKGEPEKAAKMAASIAMYTRKVAMTGGVQLQALVEKGNMSGAAKVMERVYDEMPNGMNVEVKPVKGGVEYKVFDVDGTPTDGGRMAMDEILRLSTGLQDGTAWLQGMGFMAGQYKEQQRGRGNRMSTAASPRAPAAPRTTATERAATAAAEAENAARGARGAAIAGKADALGINPDLTPSQTNMPSNVGNAPPELAAVQGVPTSVTPEYNAGTGARRVMPEEGQSLPSQSPEERMAGDISTAGERAKKEQQLVTGARTDEMMVRADKEYNARANRKGVRTSDTSSSRTENAEGVVEGFTQAGNKALPPDRAGVVNGIAAKIMRGNEGYTATDAGRVIGEIMQKGPALRPDGTIAPRGGSTSGVYLDSGSIRQLTELYGGKVPSVSGVDPKLTPKNYRMPAERKYSEGARSIADAMRGSNREGGGTSEQPKRTNRYNETWRKRREEQRRNGEG